MTEAPPPPPGAARTAAKAIAVWFFLYGALALGISGYAWFGFGGEMRQGLSGRLPPGSHSDAGHLYGIALLAAVGTAALTATGLPHLAVAGLFLLKRRVAPWMAALCFVDAGLWAVVLAQVTIAGTGTIAVAAAATLAAAHLAMGFVFRAPSVRGWPQ